MTEISAYERAARQILAFLAFKQINVQNAERPEVEAFILDRFSHGLKRQSVEGVIDNLRFFFEYHRHRLKIRPSFLNIQTVRTVFKQLNTNAIAKTRVRGTKLLMEHPRLLNRSKLKSVHNRFHPR